MKYSVYGKIRLGRGERNFRKDVEAESEKAAHEKVYALFGSQNGVKRSMVSIEKTEKS